jgi:protein subunit release factor A
MADKYLLFSINQSEFTFQTFCTGGAGGQHRNAKQNGVRCIHNASNARAEHRDGRDQRKNKEEAFRKCAATPQFKAWHAAEVMRRLGKLREVDEAVERQMQSENIRVEYGAA